MTEVFVVAVASTEGNDLLSVWSTQEAALAEAWRLLARGLDADAFRVTLDQPGPITLETALPLYAT